MTVALDQVAALIQRETGIRVAERQYPFLLAALERVEAGAGPVALLRRIADPIEGSDVLARLIEEVTIKETSLLRDRGQLASIDWRRLVKEARDRGAARVRVWTAACATGEEAYSLALLACEAFAPAPPPVSILATDISASALARGRLGSYRARSVRDVDAALRARYFRAEDGALIAGDDLRALVRFAPHNLVSGPFPPLGEAPFDLILCRNVLIYFDGETVGHVLESVERARARTGSLMLGAADVLCASASRMAGLAAPSIAPASRPQRPPRGLRRPLGRLPAAARAEVPVDAAEYFRQGLAELESNDPAAAVGSLRRALFVEPQFGIAAFKLGGAHEALGELPAARRAYQQALRALEPDERHESVLAQIDLADVATAIRARLAVLAPPAR